MSAVSNTERVMNDRTFTASFTVSQSPEEVFAAVTKPRGWWSEDIEGGTNKLNDVFTYRFEDVHLCKVKLSEVVPAKRVA